MSSSSPRWWLVISIRSAVTSNTCSEVWSGQWQVIGVLLSATQTRGPASSVRVRCREVTSVLSKPIHASVWRGACSSRLFEMEGIISNAFLRFFGVESGDVNMPVVMGCGDSQSVGSEVQIAGGVFQLELVKFVGPVGFEEE